MAIYRGPGGSGDATGDAATEASLAIAAANAAAASEANAASSASAASTSAANALASEVASASYASSLNLHSPSAIGDITPNTGAFTTLTTTDNVGLGTSSPADKLHVEGNIYLGAANRTIYTGGTGNLILQNNTGITIFSRANGASESMRIDSAGNLGLGVTPSAWGSSVKAFQFPTGFVAAVGAGPSIGYNLYYDGTNYKYVGSAAASMFSQSAGNSYWFNAPSGTAGTTASLTQAMTLDASGNLSIGSTSSSGYKFAVKNGAKSLFADTDVNNAYSYTDGGYFFGATGANSIVAITNNTERMRIDSSGNVGIGATSPAVKLEVNSTDAIKVPVGTTAQRPTGATGYIRFNSTLSAFEAYNGIAWGSIGGGATGGGSDAVFYENSKTITTNYTITSGKNAMSTGPLTINSGVTVTVPSGSKWAVL